MSFSQHERVYMSYPFVEIGGKNGLVSASKTYNLIISLRVIIWVDNTDGHYLRYRSLFILEN